MSDEDRLAISIMDGLDSQNCDLEVHYNYYGDRGVVDLVITDPAPSGGRGSLTVYELKSKSSIENSTGANEIIRQFNRHRKYFFEGSEYEETDYWDVSYILGFYASDFAIEHIYENAKLYNSLSDDGPPTNIHLYHPDVYGVGLPLINSAQDDPFANYAAFEDVLGEVPDYDSEWR